MDTNKKWTRRQFSKAALSMQVLITTGILSFSSCSKNVDHLSEEELLKILEVAMDDIIPAANSMPAASVIGGVDYIVKILDEYPDLKDPFYTMLNDLNQLSRDLEGDSFHEIMKEKRIQVLEKFEQSSPEEFNSLKLFVFESYYTHEDVWNAIGYEPYPTLSAGPSMEPFDESLLERVRKYSPMYIDPES